MDPIISESVHIRNGILDNALYNIQQGALVDDLAKMPRITATLNNCQKDHQPSMVEVEGKVQNYFVFVLIDPISSLSYLSPNPTDKFKLDKVKHKYPCLVQLAT